MVRAATWFKKIQILFISMLGVIALYQNCTGETAVAHSHSAQIEKAPVLPQGFLKSL